MNGLSSFESRSLCKKKKNKKTSIYVHIQRIITRNNILRWANQIKDSSDIHKTSRQYNIIYCAIFMRLSFQAICNCYDTLYRCDWNKCDRFKYFWCYIFWDMLYICWNTVTLNKILIVIKVLSYYFLLIN